MAKKTAHTQNKRNYSVGRYILCVPNECQMSHFKCRVVTYFRFATDSLLFCFVFFFFWRVNWVIISFWKYEHSDCRGAQSIVRICCCASAVCDSVTLSLLLFLVLYARCSGYGCESCVSRCFFQNRPTYEQQMAVVVFNVWSQYSD